MTRETITLTQVEQRRVIVLTQVREQRIDARHAAALLGLSLRHCRRLLAAFRRDGPVHLPPDGTRASPVEERVPVYTRRARVRVEVALGTRQELKPVDDAGGMLEETGTPSFQACSEIAYWPHGMWR